jgi:Holliday junction resolvase-like predicted endonuclease
MELTEQGHRLLESVRTEFANHGWKVQEHSFLTRRGSSVEVDLIGRKGNATVAVEVKSGSATASDIGVLRDVPALRRIIVANRWADDKLVALADSHLVILVSPDEVEDTLQRLDNELGNPRRMPPAPVPASQSIGVTQ